VLWGRAENESLDVKTLFKPLSRGRNAWQRQRCGFARKLHNGLREAAKRVAGGDKSNAAIF